jgi:formate hydrogenlyase subunit 3/multisubunit Na+/H+ antiporter MnhD subunit
MIEALLTHPLLGHGAALAVAAPLAGAVLAALMPGPRAAAAVCGIALTVMTLGVIGLFFAVQNGPLIYALGPGLAWRLDGWSAFSALMVATTAPLVLLIGGGTFIEAAGPAARHGFSLVLVAVGASVGLAFAADLASLAVWVQVIGLSLAGATALGAGARPAALGGAMRAGVALGLAGALAWFGVALALAQQGGLDVGQFRASPEGLDRASAAALILACVAAASVGLLAPFHHWASSLMGAAPGLVSLTILGISAPVGLMALGRFAAALAGVEEAAIAGAALVVLGAASALIGSVQALAARDVRRLAGYGFAAHAGCALMGLALGTADGATAAALHIASAAAGALLLAAAGGRVGAISQLDGAGRSAPLTALCAALGCFVFMGAPFTLGFASTWLLLVAMLGAGWWAGAGLVVAASLAAVAFGGRLLERLYFRTAQADGIGSSEPLHGIGLFLAVLAVAAAGVASGWVADLAAAAGASLIAWPMGGS